MTPHRSSVKIYFADGVSIEPAKIIPVFHDWIRNHTVEGLLIDVADYKHVHEGPAVVLVGHEVDYAIDLSEGRAGLQILRKRPPEGEMVDDLRSGLHRLLVAARALQENSQPHPPVRFRTDEYRVQIIDRLNFPNTTEGVEEARRALEAALGPIFSAGGFQIDGDTGDPRAPVTLRIVAGGAPGFDTLLSRL